MLCYAMLCYAMLCYAMPSFADVELCHSKPKSCHAVLCCPVFQGTAPICQIASLSIVAVSYCKTNKQSGLHKAETTAEPKTSTDLKDLIP